jgi:hypothetical protein
MRMMDGIVAWNGRQAQRFSILTIVLKAVVGFFLAGVLMAVIVPSLHARGVLLREWMVWSMIALIIAICIAPDLYQRYRKRTV